MPTTSIWLTFQLRHRVQPCFGLNWRVSQSLRLHISLFGCSGFRHGACVPRRGCFYTSCAPWTSIQGPCPRPFQTDSLITNKQFQAPVTASGFHSPTNFMINRRADSNHERHTRTSDPNSACSLGVWAVGVILQIWAKSDKCQEKWVMSS